MDGGAYDPAQALSDVATSRENAAARVITPWWYHPILGANLAGLVTAVALDLPIVTLLAACAVSVVISLTLARVYQHLTGVWVGPSDCGPRSRRTWTAFSLVIAATLALAVAIHAAHLPAGWIWADAIVCVVATIVLGRRMDAQLREEIRTGAAPIPRGRR